MKYILNILILLALVALVVLKLKDNKEIVKERVFHFDKSKPISIHTKTVELGVGDNATQITGNFMPNKDAKINAEMQGKIVSISVDEGDYVKRGKQLAKLDDSLLKLQLKQLDVKIEGLRVDINRFRILTEADAIQGVQLEKVELGLKTALAQRETILEKIKKTAVYAPFSGVITKKNVEVGSFAAPAMPLFFLTDINRLKFTVNVPESELNQFKIGRSYPISVDAFPHLSLKGKTTMIATRGNMGNSYPVQFEVKNTKKGSIKAGMFGKLIINTDGTKKESIVIPASAIVGSTVKPKVYIISGGKVTLSEVVISKRLGSNVVIESGLKSGDRIATSGFINLYDGANVTF